MNSVNLVPFDPPRDLSVVAEWLHQPHVARWWGDPARALAEVKDHPVDTEALIQAESKSVGYLCWQTLTEEERTAAGLSDLPTDLVDIDIMIGDPEFVGQGLGPEALAQLLVKLRADGVDIVGLGTALANQRALKAYTKAGFRTFRDFHEAGEQMTYLIQSLRRFEVQG